MLPTGHFAAGYLTTKLAIAALLPYFPQADATRFWAMGLAMSVLPDLDEFLTFYRIRRFTGNSDVNHRKFITHTPFFHLAIGASGFVFGKLTGNPDLSLFSILYVVGTWTHFLFDSFFYGIMWLWPWSKKHYAFRYAAVDFQLPDAPFLRYWLNFLLAYSKNYVFYLEVLVIGAAFLVYYS
jgi:hypothetical protein